MQKNAMSDYQNTNRQKFDDFYRGLVEDNADPEKRGRCRVRVYGLHTELLTKNDEGTEGIPTEELPWAEPILGTSGSSGAGAFTVPATGTYVLVFFEAGNPMAPRYMGTIPGQPSGVPEKPPRNAFPSDPPGGVQDPGPLPENESDIVMTLTRTSTANTGTLGTLTSSTGFSCKVIELPWKQNKNGVSCIPPKPSGYKCKLRSSNAWPNTYWVSDVSGRVAILIHNGNWAGDEASGYKTNTQGCILLGSAHGTGSPKGKPQSMCTDSNSTLAAFKKHLQGKPFTLKVIDNTGTMS